MRLRMGPIHIALREKKAAPQHIELGATGTLIFAGQLTEEEYNPDLRGEKAVQVYERMRKSDGQVKGALLACTLPLREARWDVTPASKSSEDIEIADFVRANLFEQMTITWDDFLSHVLLMLPFGFSVFEKVWELVDGRYRWRKLAPRLAKTIKEWYMDPEGGLEHIVQYAYKGGMYQQISIPVEKLLVFTLEREGSNFQGTSLLRAAYKHWYYKDQLYRIDGIAAERHGVGLSVFTLPRTVTEDDRAKVDKIGQTLHTHERSYIALPEGYGFDLKGVAGQLHQIIRSIEHHDTQIVRSILAQFIQLGTGKVGSYALSQDQSGFFLMALRAVGKNVCETMNRHAIRQMVGYNWDVDRYPRLTVSGLEHKNIADYCKAIGDLIGAGAITPDSGIEEELRRLLHLPPAQKGEDKPSQFRLAEFRPSRRPRGPETHVAFAEINDKLNSSEKDFVEAAKEVQDRQIVKITDTVIAKIEKGEIEKVATVDVPYREQMTKAVERILLDLFEYGQRQVRQEITKQRGTLKAQDPLGEAGSEAVEGFLKTRAKGTANVLASKLRAAMVWEALRQVKGGVVNKLAFGKALTDLSDRELVATAKFSVAEAFAFGRQIEAKRHADEIDRVVYSAILDENNCGRCAELDGKEFTFPSVEWDDVAPPYRECEGGDRCRCMGVYIYKSEK